MARSLSAACIAVFVTLSAVHAQELRKDHSILYTTDVIARVRENVSAQPWAAQIRDRVVEEAAFWKDMSDDDLWKLMFGPTLERSWMVWSNGYSPITGKPVPMYTWQAETKEHPWKLQDPTSGEWFPKNDFKAFYDSGLDEHGIFDPARANRDLLFNTEHPDPNDPLHRFGVDDGTGYVNEKGEKWRFIAAYLIYGQWKQSVVGGIRILSAAYVLTGDPVYAHKAGVLLDRVADIYPSMNFGKQGVMYEGPPSAGYVSTWHDACEETREMVMAYDMVFEALRSDQDLIAFLSKKASEVGLQNPKASFADIQRNIEGGILRDALLNQDRIHSNYPRTEITKAIITSVLQEPDEAFWTIVDPMLDKATAVDGVTGEKGLAGYSCFTIAGLASFLAEYSKSDSTFLPRVLDRQPRLRDTYRFFIDTMCLQRYYPLSGDCGHFAASIPTYVGINFLKPSADAKGWPNWTLLPPSNYRLLWDLYKATGDVAYVQTLYRANDSKIDGLPYDFYGNDPAQFQRDVAVVIDREGTQYALPSVNKQQWHLGILRSGRGANERALWLDYDAGGGHGHKDGMNLGLFAYGLDLMPELGYPPVQFGGWDSPRARWYTMTAAHNTVLVDNQNQAVANGATTLWLDGRHVHGIRATGEAIAQAERYERTALLIDVDESRSYVVDVFRVRGGHNHTKFQQSHFGALTTTGLNLAPAEDFGAGTQLRNTQLDPAPQPGWKAEWAIEDRYKLLPEPAKLGVSYWDFTTGAAAGTVEGWIVTGSYNESQEDWIPRVMVRRQNEGDVPLESTFVAVTEPWKDASCIQSVRRVEANAPDGTLLGDTEVALEVQLADGSRDCILVRDVDRKQNQSDAVSSGGAIATDAEVAVVRIDTNGVVTRATTGNGSKCVSGTFTLQQGAAKMIAEYDSN
ncbi:MAG: heparinase II/III-family protein [Candidatus Hydrogenedentes bacterium]|nr:heparinase II/III-family protein [Candidatus Hydrogenedentota bacterium]